MPVPADWTGEAPSRAARLRAALPTATIPLTARAGARVLRRDPQRVAQARLQMDALVGARRTPAELDGLAQAYLRYWAWRSESRQHPAHETTQPVEGAEHLVSLTRAGLPAIVSFIHQGAWEGGLASVVRQGAALDVIVDDGMVDLQGPKHMHDVRRKGTSTGLEIFGVREGARGIIARLKAGKQVGISLDVPGPTPTTFLGREVHLATSNVGLARKLDVPIVAISVLRTTPDVGGTPRVVVHEPLRPADFDDEMALHGALKAIHEAAAEAWPESYEQPTERMHYPGFSTPA
ncbi:hypothetical protein [Nocardioides sp. TRM66260-LWL]|uniref:LpxL/LpxP family acyltransferase n=1 Tax=Nocardioides sp. TRM66260-LWL TaxID=2874478 RepID=UPI0021E157F4|nr:hypothetical protein [Nocardioides sp. TRM66260-LWL]